MAHHLTITGKPLMLRPFRGAEQVRAPLLTRRRKRFGTCASGTPVWRFPLTAWCDALASRLFASGITVCDGATQLLEGRIRAAGYSAPSDPAWS